MGFDSNALKEMQRKKRVEESKWKETYKKGLPYYILKKGFVGLTIPSAALMGLVMYINKSFESEKSGWEFLVLFLLFVAVGSLYSYIVWNLNNRKYIYKKNQKNKESKK